ncbi:hypothetical protein HN670_02520 [bacterium]|jgi:hypothetical protein|nr:hypothetical protein [bacterium]
MNILQELLDQSKDIDPATVKLPTSEPGDNETIAGIMSDDAKRLCGLQIQLSNKMKAILTEIKSLDKDSDRYRELDLELEIIDLRKDMVQNLILTTVLLEFPEIIGKISFLIRKDGQVCWKFCNQEFSDLEVMTVILNDMPIELCH